MKGISRPLAVTGIGAVVKQNADISCQLLAAHALPGMIRPLSCGE